MVPIEASGIQAPGIETSGTGESRLVPPATERPVEDSAGIRTYKPRRGRVTPRQAAALAVPDGLLLAEPTQPLDLASAFAGRPVVYEIGFGTGAATVELAQADPDTGILAIDVHTPGIGDLLWRIRQAGLANVRVIEADALRVLRTSIGPSALAGVRTYFPDPWPKARHHKRRLVNAENARLIADRTASGGAWHLATDWLAYAEQAIAVLDAEPAWTGGVIERPSWRPVTRYERLALDQGREIIDLWYTKSPGDGENGLVMVPHSERLARVRRP